MKLLKLSVQWLTEWKSPIKKKVKSQDKQHCSTLRDTITMKMTNLQVNSTQP